MGSRYGRNKRRAHRERIAELEAAEARLGEAVEMGRGLAEHLRQERDRAVQNLSFIADQLVAACGPETALLPLSMKDVANIGRDLRRWPVKAPPPSLVGPAELSPFSESFAVVDLIVLAARVRDDPGSFNRLIEFVDVSHTGQFEEQRVALSMDTYRRYGLREDTIRFLMREVTKQFIAAEAERRAPKAEVA
jgi:hypothetical protein